MKLKNVIIQFTLILFALVLGACTGFSRPTIPFAEAYQTLTAAAPTVTLTQAPVTPTATLPASVPGLPTLPPPPANTITPPPQPQPTSSVKRISFAPGATSATVQNSLGVNGIDYYALRVSAGQKMRVNLTSPQANIIFSVSGVDGQVLKSSGAGRGPWEGVVPTTQDYMLIISTENGMAANYTLQVTIPPLAPVVESTPVPKRISFAPGGISASVQGVLSKNGMDRWVIRVQAGQTMTAKAIPQATTAQLIPQDGNVMLIVFGVDGDVYQTDHVGSPDFSAQMRTTQDYYIDVRAWGDTAPSYTLQVTIPPK